MFWKLCGSRITIRLINTSWTHAYTNFIFTFTRLSNSVIINNQHEASRPSLTSHEGGSPSVSASRRRPLLLSICLGPQDRFRDKRFASLSSEVDKWRQTANGTLLYSIWHSGIVWYIGFGLHHDCLSSYYVNGYVLDK